MSVLLALADIGPGVHLEEALTHAGYPARWDAALADGPAGDVGSPNAVVIDADHLGARLPAVADLWRAHPASPGVVALGSSAAAREHVPAARCALIAPSASTPTLVAAIRQAQELRLSSTMSWPVMRAALGLPPIGESAVAWAQTVAAARAVDLEIPRAALRWHASHYVTGTAKLDAVIHDRILALPELDTARAFDGTLTVQRFIHRGPLDPAQSVRLVWTLASLGAVELTPEVRDLATGHRRLLHDLRAHLRARMVRLEKSTFYDVLEITPAAEVPDIENAYVEIGRRYSPRLLAAHDLGELAAQIKPMWELVEKARSVLVDIAARGRYHDWLRAKLRELRTSWAIEARPAEVAAEAYVRGQTALGNGDVHRAMSELATACRHHPGHPEYEASLAWARYRVQVDSGKDRVATAIAERALVEDHQLGHRAWPRALVALALLCIAAGDADSARWHIHVALSFDPSLPAAAQLAQRLGMRR